MIINDAEQTALKQAAGELDISPIRPADYATVVRPTQSTHSVVSWSTLDWQGAFGLALCQTAKDLDKRALFQDARFREALSIAVDRNLLNMTLMNGQSRPQQAAPSPGALGYDPEWLTKWTEYNVERANQLLDEITEPWDRKEGTRKVKGTNRDVRSISISNPSVEATSPCQSAYKAIVRF